MKMKTVYKDSIVDGHLILTPTESNPFQTFTQKWCFHIMDVDIIVRHPFSSFYPAVCRRQWPGSLCAEFSVETRMLKTWQGQVFFSFFIILQSYLALMAKNVQMLSSHLGFQSTAPVLVLLNFAQVKVLVPHFPFQLQLATFFQTQSYPALSMNAIFCAHVW